MKKAVLLFGFSILAVPAAAQEDADLSLIPGSVQQDTAPVASVTPESLGKYALSDAFGWYAYRGTMAVPSSSDIPSRWSNRLSADALASWKLGGDLRLTVSDVLSVSSADGTGFPRESVRNDLRELYVTWDVTSETFLEAGRINVRYGVALGYNPTDFFRARSAVAQSSSDPGALRNNRLGTVMIRAQHVYSGGSLEFIYAPKLHSPVPLGGLADPFDPKFDQTNGSDRLAASWSFAWEDFSPQLLVFYEEGRAKFGFNASHPVGNSIIAYLSWAGGNAPSVIADAIAFGKRTGTLPAAMPVLPAVSFSRGFKSDISAGASWTGEYKQTVSVEYNFHEAGFSKDVWRAWFDTGADPTLSSLMWYIRGYANDRQQPASQHQAFIRADWAEPFHIPHSDINGYVMANLTDGSTTGQLSASYDLSDYWSFGAFVSATTGGRRTEWGSLRGSASAIVQVVRYL